MRTVFMGVAAMILVFMVSTEFWSARSEKSLAQTSEAPAAVAALPEITLAAFDEASGKTGSVGQDIRPPAEFASLDGLSADLGVDPLPSEPLGVDNPPTSPIVISSRETALPEPDRVLRPDQLAPLSSSELLSIDVVDDEVEAKVSTQSPTALDVLLVDSPASPLVDLSKPKQMEQAEDAVLALKEEPPAPKYLPKSIYGVVDRSFRQEIAQEARPQIEEERRSQFLFTVPDLPIKPVELVAKAEEEPEFAVKTPRSRPAGLSEAPALAKVDIAKLSVPSLVENAVSAPSASVNDPVTRGLAAIPLSDTADSARSLPNADTSAPNRLALVKPTETTPAVPTLDGTNLEGLAQKSTQAETPDAPADQIALLDTDAGANLPMNKTAQEALETVVQDPKPEPKVQKKKAVKKKKAVRKKKTVRKAKKKAPPKSAGLTAGERASLSRAIARCYRAPASLKSKPEVRVRMRVGLTKDGFLTSSPKFISGGGSRAANDGYNAARRALIRCQPYKLPANKYGAWRSVTVTATASSIGAR